MIRASALWWAHHDPPAAVAAGQPMRLPEPSTRSDSEIRMVEGSRGGN
jgi:hypothetical protein